MGNGQVFLSQNMQDTNMICVPHVDSNTSDFGVVETFSVF
jgi:hypothetical protein